MIYVDPNTSVASFFFYFDHSHTIYDFGCSLQFCIQLRQSRCKMYRDESKISIVHIWLSFCLQFAFLRAIASVPVQNVSCTNSVPRLRIFFSAPQEVTHAHLQRTDLLLQPVPRCLVQGCLNTLRCLWITDGRDGHQLARPSPASRNQN